MQATQISRPTSPGWISWILLVGSVVLFGWAWFVLGFLSEPSAVGRTWIALVVIGGTSTSAAVCGLIAAAGLLRPTHWATPLAFLASVLMIISIVGAVAGIPALIGVLSSRTSSRN